MSAPWSRPRAQYPGPEPRAHPIHQQAYHDRLAQMQTELQRKDTVIQQLTDSMNQSMKADPAAPQVSTVRRLLQLVRSDTAAALGGGRSAGMTGTFWHTTEK